MDADKLYEQLKKIQEAKGFYFNKDMEKTMFLIKGLFVSVCVTIQDHREEME